MIRTALAVAAGLLCAAAGWRRGQELCTGCRRQERWAAVMQHLSLLLREGAGSLPEVLDGEIPDCWTLVFGNEGSGLPAAFATMGQPVRIPSNERIDSLNLSIAAAIGIYGFTRR